VEGARVSGRSRPRSRSSASIRRATPRSIRAI
jgi:hypothetical protein